MLSWSRLAPTVEMDMVGIRCQICSWEFCWGGSYFWKGVRKKGGSDEPPEPPWLRA